MIRITIIERFIGTNAERLAMITTGIHAGSVVLTSDNGPWTWTGTEWLPGEYY